MDDSNLDYRYGLALEVRPTHIDVTSDDPERFIYDTIGKIVLYDADGDSRLRVGDFRLTFVDVEGAIAARESVLDVFDAERRTLEYFEALYDIDSASFTRAVHDAAGGASIFCPNLLILDRLTILPRHRGHGVGLAVLIQLMRRFGPGAGLIAMKPFPLQLEATPPEDASARRGLRLSVFPKNGRAATAELWRYYSKLGFRLVRGTKMMVFDPFSPLPEPATFLANSKSGTEG